MTASLTDLLTAQKNGVVAINGVLQSNLRGQGTVTSDTVTADTLVVSGKGYLVSYTLVASGSANGMIYNANSIALTSASNALCPTDKSLANVVKTGLVFTNGLVIRPGAGQSINVTYYLG